jgi:hypothetical protein
VSGQGKMCERSASHFRSCGIFCAKDGCCRMVFNHKRGLVCRDCMPPCRWRECTTPSCGALIHAHCASYVIFWRCPRCTASGIQHAPMPQLHPSKYSVSPNPLPMATNKFRSENAEQQAIVVTQARFKDSRDRDQVDVRISMAKRDVLRARRYAALLDGIHVPDNEVPPVIQGEIAFFSRIHKITYDQLKTAMRFPFDLKPRQPRCRPRNIFTMVKGILLRTQLMFCLTYRLKIACFDAVNCSAAVCR